MISHLIPIITVGAFVLAIVIERSWALYWKYPLDVKAFLAEIKQRIMSNNIASAIQLCADQKQALGAAVTKAGLLRASRDNAQIIASLEIAAHDAITNIKKRVGYLAMLANVATLLGLLGTIAGLIESFAAVANVDAATKSQLLAQGISTAMNATASGLAVAIPAMIAFSILQSKANRLADQVEQCAMVTHDILSSRLYRDEEWAENENSRPNISVMSKTNGKVA